MKTVSVDYYTIIELKERFPMTYKKVIEKNRDYNTYFEWYEYTIEDLKTLLGFCGFENPDIQFSGFGSQGDGASFSGTCDTSKINLHGLCEYAPKEDKFRKLATDIKNLTKDFPDCKVILTRYHCGGYVHENTIGYDAEYTGEVSGYENMINGVKDSCKSIMREIYARLENEYTEITSDSAIEESLDASECYFDENGRPE